MPLNNIHAHYDCLTVKERDFVDACFAEIFNDAKLQGIRLLNTDPAERAVDALAKLIMESRPKVEEPAPRFGKPVRLLYPTPTKAEALERERNAFDSYAAKVRP